MISEIYQVCSELDRVLSSSCDLNLPGPRKLELEVDHCAARYGSGTQFRYTGNTMMNDIITRYWGLPRKLQVWTVNGYNLFLTTSERAMSRYFKWFVCPFIIWMQRFVSEFRPFLPWHLRSAVPRFTCRLIIKKSVCIHSKRLYFVDFTAWDV